jgi:serine protease Do
VITYDGTEYRAMVKGYDANNDLAVLKVEAQDLPAVTLGSSSDLIIGDMVVAIGNPLGELTSTQTVGYISGKDRDVTTDGTIINMLQTDAAINPGNSGGPLFNMKGEVIGITTAKYSGTTSSGASIEGIGFAVPTDDVIGMIKELMEKGFISAPYMGITIDQRADGIGVYVISVDKGTPAEAAGLRAGDIIVGLGEYEVDSLSVMDKMLRNFNAGDTTSVFVYRNRQVLELTITFGEKNQPAVKPAAGEVPENADAEKWYEFWLPNFGN